MSISYTHTSFVAAIKAYAADTDNEFVARIPDFIGKAETRTLRDLDLELFEQFLDVTVSTGSRFVSKPSDVIEVNGLWLSPPSGGGWFEVPRRSFEYCLLYAPAESFNETPSYFSEYDEDQIYIVGTPNQTFSNGLAKVRATIRPSGLTASNPTTFLSLHFGDLLFSACMIEAYDFLKHPAKMQEAATKYQSLIPSLSTEVEDILRKHYSGLNNQRQGADD